MTENRFRNSVGVRLLRGLFFEETLSDKSSVVYTLKDQDHEGFPSLYRLYMETNDPTEWKFANAHMDGWDHWERLCECTWFKPYAERWRKELFLRLQSEALARIMAEGKTNSKNAFTANRYLTERAWEPRGDSKRGRPTKTEVKAAAHAVAASNSQIDDDYRRLVPILPN